MKDVIGQEIKVDSTVLWMSGQGKYAGSAQYIVTKITEKRVAIVPKVEPKYWDKKAKYIHPLDLVVIDINLRTLKVLQSLKQQNAE